MILSAFVSFTLLQHSAQPSNITAESGDAAVSIVSPSPAPWQTNNAELSWIVQSTGINPLADGTNARLRTPDASVERDPFADELFRALSDPRGGFREPDPSVPTPTAAATFTIALSGLLRRRRV